MRSDFFLRCQPKLQLLDEGQKREIHLASLSILMRTGVLVHQEEARELLRKAGCEVDPGHRVRIPAAVVEDAVRGVPPKIRLVGQGW